MANLKCTGRIQSDAIDIVDAIEIGSRNGNSNSPCIDFHTDGSEVTNFNVRMMAQNGMLNITAKDGVFVNGNPLIDIVDSGANYIRFSNLTQICWGRADEDNTNYQKNITISFKPFKNTNYTIIASPHCSRTDNVYMYNLATIKSASLQTSSAIIYEASTNSASWNNGVFWIAIGEWVKDNGGLNVEPY